MYCTYVVGRYKKAGNFIGKYKENVGKGTFSEDICGKLDDMIAKFGGGGWYFKLSFPLILMRVVWKWFEEGSSSFCLH